MANKIYIWGNFPEGNTSDALNGKVKETIGSNKLLEFPLLDDVVLEAGTEWTSFTEDLGDVADLVTTVAKIKTASGNADSNTISVLNIFDAKRWKKTNPFKFSVRIPLYTKTNPKKDVFDIYKALMGYTILYKVEGIAADLYKLPGINLANLNNYVIANKDKKGDTGNRSELLKDGRFVAIEIPGVIYLKEALIESVRPTISKEITESRYPLWMILEITFEGLYPATTGDLDLVDTSPISSSFESRKF